MAESMVMYQSFHNATKELPLELYGLFYYTLNEYAFNGIEPPEDLNPMIKMAFELVRPQIDANRARQENGKKGGAPRGNRNAVRKAPVEKENNLKQPVDFSENNPNQLKQPNDNVNVNDNLNVNDNVNECAEAAPQVKPAHKRFVKPSVAEIAAYCNERGNGIDAERFFDYYESKGWKVGKQPMQNWQAAVRTWEKSSNSIFSSQNRHEELPPNKLLL